MKAFLAALTKKKLLYYILLTFFLGVFVFSAVHLISYWNQSRQAQDTYDDLAQILDDLRASAPPPANPNDNPDNTGVTAPPQSGEPTILPEYLPFYELNNDTVGWISIPDTKVNYPVVHTPDEPDYYLKRDFYKRSSDWGAIFADEKCDINRPSDNVILYGHHMKDGSMFATLDKYKNQSFYEQHPIITFDTLYERHTYQIYAVFKISADNNPFPYHMFTQATTLAEYDDYVAMAKSLGFYDTGFTPTYGDKLLTLSTCEYSLTNGRLVVCAFRIS